MEGIRTRPTLFLVSACVAVAAYLTPRVVMHLALWARSGAFDAERLFWTSAIALPLIWLAIFGWAVYVHRWWSLWLLFGLPLALQWPYLLFGAAHV